MKSVFLTMHSLLIFSVIVFLAADAQAFSGGPPDGRTNAPGESNCTISCHTTFPLDSGDGSLELLDLPAAYDPGQTYLLRVRLSDPSAQRWGFELTSLDAANAPAGDLAAVDANTQTSTATSGREYIKHTSAGTAFGTTGSQTWSMQWTAPAAGTGTVRFYFAGNGANGNFSNSGDRIYATSAGLDEATATAAPSPRSVARLLANRPNPFNPRTTIVFELDADSPVRLEVFDLRGQHIRTLVQGLRARGRHEVQWNGRDGRGRAVASGVYRAVLISDGQREVRTMSLLK